MFSDGILGLSPKRDGRVELLVEKLSEAGVIDQAVFSLYLTNERSTSRLFLGGIDQALVDQYATKVQEEDEEYGLENKEAGDSIYWMNNNSNNHWGVVLYGARIGGAEIDLEYENLIFDSGASLIYIPMKSYY